jgi:hypothetical protein
MLHSESGTLTAEEGSDGPQKHWPANSPPETGAPTEAHRLAQYSRVRQVKASAVCVGNSRSGEST